MAKTSIPLQNLALKALELGFRCYCDGDHVPFVMIVAKDGQRRLVDFASAGGIIDAAHVKFVREIARETFSSTRRYALVWSGHPRDESNDDAVVAEATEPGLGQSIVLVQRYRQKKGANTFVKVGKPVNAQYYNDLSTARESRFSSSPCVPAATARSTQRLRSDGSSERNKAKQLATDHVGRS